MDKKLEDSIYQSVLEVVRSQSLGKGTPVSDKDLAESFNVSRTPVRMALARLEGEGLIDKRPSGGWIVPPITIEDIEEIFDIKEALGSILVRKAAEHITEDGVLLLREALEGLRVAAEAGREDQWTPAHDHYDRTLYTIAHHKRLQESLNLLENQWYRLKVGYSSIGETLSAYVEDTLLDHYEQHKAVCDAIIDRDPDLAVEKNRLHIQRYSTGLIKVVREILVPLLGQEL